jgi:pimeloyl-ACP methyl ester carboxylesterase
VLLLPGYPGNPTDVLGMGERLSSEGINVFFALPRGMHGSEGEFSFHGALEDIGVAFEWLHTPEVIDDFGVNTSAVFICGYSWGGGMSMAYAASDPAVQGVISIAGTDHGEFMREFERNEEMASMVRQMISQTQAPEGPVRFQDLEQIFREISEGVAMFGLRENASKLADRSILLIGGWEDVNITIEDQILPLYRALLAAGADNTSILAYHDDHGFSSVRDQIGDDIIAWIMDIGNSSER